MVARRVEIDGEDRTLEVSLAVEVPGAGGATDYRAAPSPLRRSFRVTLGDRWLGGKDHAPFLHGATFPILIGKGKAAKLFVQHEALDAGEVTD